MRLRSPFRRPKFHRPNIREEAQRTKQDLRRGARIAGRLSVSAGKGLGKGLTVAGGKLEEGIRAQMKPKPPPRPKKTPKRKPVAKRGAPKRRKATTPRKKKGTTITITVD